MHRHFLVTLLATAVAVGAETQVDSPSVSEKIASTHALAGLFPLYWDEKSGTLYLEVTRWNEEFLYVSSLTAGLGSNDIGLDRNQLGATRVVRFERVGPKVLLMQTNYDYRAVTENAAERQAVKEAFAESVVWGFEAVAEEDGRVLVDATAFLLRDAHGVADALSNAKQGDYKLDESRSAVYLPRTKNFERNTEMEALLTFTGKAKGEFVRSVAADADALTLRQHHSFVELPDEGYKPRVFDPRAGSIAIHYYDYATPIDQPLEKRFIARHRLKKLDPDAAVSAPVEPIVYYLDPGTPEPIRSALLEGARWWNEAFEAIGYRDAFQVLMLPEDADPMDVNYNVINWVHRATRGWSYGSSVVDPRTGEIIKGHVTLGSLRVRQDYLIAQGLVPSFGAGGAGSAALQELALARLRQLSAHEVGHTLGFAHNFAASADGLASVMDYPHPVIAIIDDTTLSLETAYDTGIGGWDKAVVAYSYQDFSEGTDEAAALEAIIRQRIADGLQFVSDVDARLPGGAHPEAHLWDNGADTVAELRRMMQVREIALRNFSADTIPEGTALSYLEDVLVPIYLLHRYQTEAAAKVLGGLDYSYAVKGDGQTAVAMIDGAVQRAALAALLETISTEALTPGEQILGLIPPRAYGQSRHRELFATRTGLTLDAVSMAEGAAGMTAQFLLHPARLSRIVQQHARKEEQPGLHEVLQAVLEATWRGPRPDGLAGEIQRAVNVVVLQRLLQVAADETAAPQVRAVLEAELEELGDRLARPARADDPWRAHIRYGVSLIARYFENPAEFAPTPAPELPPGSPIGNGLGELRCDF